jgi:hypothetical protein
VDTDGRGSKPVLRTCNSGVCDRWGQLVSDGRRLVTDPGALAEPVRQGRNGETGGADATQIAQTSKLEIDPLRQFIDTVIVPALVEGYLRERRRPSPTGPTLFVLTSAAP